MRHMTAGQREELIREILLGVTALPRRDTPSIRSVRRDFSDRLAEISPEDVIAVALRLVKRSELHYRFFAYELVQFHKQALRSLTAKTLEELGNGIDSWGAVDSFACCLSGPVWRDRQISDAVVRRWARSKDRWWRRAALVSTVTLNSKARGGQGDASRTLEICELLVHDHDDMVVKAMSWALRELGKRSPESTYSFLDRYEGRLARRVTREVKNKLTTGLKNVAHRSN